MFPTTTSFFIALTTILHVHVEAAPLPIDIFGSIFGTNEPAASSLVTALTADQVTSKLVRPALLSRVAYCSAAAVKSMTCDGPCEALGGQVEVVHAEGDDQLIPGCASHVDCFGTGGNITDAVLCIDYIAIDRSINSVVVAHQGTERKNMYVPSTHLSLRENTHLTSVQRFSAQQRRLLPRTIAPRSIPQRYGLNFSLACSSSLTDDGDNCSPCRS